MKEKVVLLILVSVLLFSVMFRAKFVEAETWTTAEIVSTESTESSWYPSLAVDSSGNIHIAWSDRTNYGGSGTDDDIFYKKYEAGTGWSTTEVVSTESTENSWHPSLAVDSSGNIHIAWACQPDYGGSGTDENIFYKKRTTSWSTTEVVSTEYTVDAYAPSLAVDASGNIHIAWQDGANYEGAGTDYDIFYKKYEAGAGWSTTEVVSTESTEYSWQPSLAVDSSGNIHIAWEDGTNHEGAGTDYDIFYKKYEAGTGWSTTEVVSTESTRSSGKASLAVDTSGNIHIAWNDRTDYGSGFDGDIFYKKRTTSWSTTEVVSTESTGGSYSPSLAVDFSGNVHVAWMDWTDYGGSGTDEDIFYKKYEAGAGWSTTEVVSTESTGDSTWPSLAVDASGNIHIAWDDLIDSGSGTDRDIFYRRYEVGVGLSTTEVVSTESTRTSTWPSLAVDASGNAHVAWHDYTNYGGSGTDSDIFYKKRTTSWSITEVVSTESTGGSYNPSLAVDSSGHIHVAWTDQTDYEGAGTDYDIFYKKYEAGAGWSTTEVVSTESTGDSFRPSLAVDSSGNVHVAWMDWTDYGGSGTDEDIFYKKYEAGAGWSITEVVSTESTGDAYEPSLAVDSSGNVHVAWNDYTDYEGSGTDEDIFYRNRTTSWSTTEIVSRESTRNSTHASLVVDSSDHIHVAWMDHTDLGGAGTDSDIFYKKHVTNRSTTEVVSTESTKDSYFPSLAVDASGSAHVAWHDYTDYGGSGTDSDIFYKKRTTSWSTTEVVSTDSTKGSYFPSLAVESDGNAHVAWNDYTDLRGCGIDEDVFYKKLEGLSDGCTTPVCWRIIIIIIVAIAVISIAIILWLRVRRRT